MKKFNKKKKYTFNVFRWLSNVASRFTDADVSDVDTLIEILQDFKDLHQKEVEVVDSHTGLVFNPHEDLDMVVGPEWCEEI